MKFHMDLVLETTSVLKPFNNYLFDNILVQTIL